MPPFGFPFFRRRVRFQRRRMPYRRFGMSTRRGLIGRRPFTRSKPEINYKEFVLATSFAGTGLSVIPDSPVLWNTEEDVTAGTLLTPANLNRIVVGASQNERIGRKILLKSIQLKTEIVGIPKGAEPTSPYSIHVAMIRFRNQQGRAPQAENIWKYITAGMVTTHYAPIRNQDHLRDYEVIFHKKRLVKTDWEFVPSTDAVAGYFRTSLNIYKKFKKPLIVNYYANNTTPTSASIEQGGIYFYVWSDSATFADTSLDKSLCTVKFLDM